MSTLQVVFDGILWRAVVNSEAEALLLADVRNACKPTFAHFNGQLDFATQRAWFEQDGIRHAWLYWTRHHVLPVGFGLLARGSADGESVATVGVKPESSKKVGISIGRAIMSDLAALWPLRPLVSYALKTNERGTLVHATDVWQETACDNPNLRRYEAK